MSSIQTPRSPADQSAYGMDRGEAGELPGRANRYNKIGSLRAPSQPWLPTPGRMQWLYSSFIFRPGIVSSRARPSCR